MPNPYKRAAFRLPIHKGCEEIRLALGWDRRKLVSELGMARERYATLSSGTTEWSAYDLERFREVTGIDPYVNAYILYADMSKLPESTQACLRALRLDWEEQLRRMRYGRQLLPGGR